MLRVSVVALVVACSGCGRIGFDEAPLALAPATSRSNLNTRTTFVASGGTPPYTFAITAGSGTLDAVTGEFRAPSYPGAASVEVIDAAGAVATAEIDFGGDALYAVGGYVNDVARDEVWRSTDGATWEVVGRLPAARGGGALVVLEDRLIYAGGSNGPEGTSFAEVWASTDGIAWAELGQLPAPMYASATAVFEGRMWLVGGRLADESYATRVLSSRDGATWQAEPSLTVGLHGGEAAVVDDALWLVAGHESANQTAAIWARRGDGSWTANGDVPVAGEYHAVTVHAGELWVAGGLGLRDRVVTSSDGTTWADHQRLPLDRDYATLIGWQDALWVVAGIPAMTWRSDDGAAWSVAGSFPALTTGSSIVQFTPRP